MLPSRLLELRHAHSVPDATGENSQGRRTASGSELTHVGGTSANHALGRVHSSPADRNELAHADGSSNALFGWSWLESRQARRASYAVLALELGVLIAFSIVYKPFDLNIYLWGGHAALHGLRLYAVQADKNWFTYPPFAAAVFTPLAELPGVVVRLVWQLGTVAAFAWACILTLKLAGYRPSRTAVLAMVAAGLALEPMYHTLYLGQVNIFLLTMVLIDIWRASRGRSAGIGIGVAAAIKLTPLIFIPLLLLTKKTRDALIAADTFVLCGLVGYLVDPSASRLYWTRLFYDTRRVSASYISNQSVYAALSRVLDGVGHVGSWYLVPVAIIGVCGLAVATTLGRRGDWLGAAAMTGVTGLVVSPISWTHHWVWVLPALVVLMRGGVGSRVAAGVGYLVFGLGPMWFTPHTPSHGEFGFQGVLTILANCFLICGLAFMAYMAVITYLPQQEQPPSGLGLQVSTHREAILSRTTGALASSRPGWVLPWVRRWRMSHAARLGTAWHS